MQPLCAFVKMKMPEILCIINYEYLDDVIIASSIKIE